MGDPAQKPAQQPAGNDWQDYSGGEWQDETSTPVAAAPPEHQGWAQDRAITEAWAKDHPIAGPVARFLVNGGQAVSGAIAGTPGAIYHAFSDPASEDELTLSSPQRVFSRLGGRDAANALQDYGAGKVTPKAAMSVLPEALGQGLGTVAGGAAYGKIGGVLPEVVETAPRVLRTARDVTPVLNKVNTAWEANSPENVVHAREMADPMRVATRHAVEEGRATEIPTRLPKEQVNPRPPIDPMTAATNAAVKEGTASRIPTRLSPTLRNWAEPPQSAALGRIGANPGSVSGNLGTIPVSNDPFAGVDALRAKLTAVPRESWGMGEITPTTLPQDEVLGRLGTTAGEKAAENRFFNSNPSALGRIGEKGAAGGPGEGGSPISGTLPRGYGRLVLTPEEALQRDQMMRVAQRSAHDRGMQFAGGQVPAEGRGVPTRPLANPTEEWRGVRGEEDLDREIRGGGGNTPAENVRQAQDKVNSLRMQAEREQANARTSSGAEAGSSAYNTVSKLRAAEEELERLQNEGAKQSVNPARDTSIMQQLKQEHPDWTDSQRLQEAANRARQARSK